MITPSGCRHCGAAEQHHPWLWTEAAGLHQYVEPTQDQIKHRMRQRRQQKENHSEG